MDMWICWLIIVIFLAFIELSTTSLITVWYIISAFVAMIVSLFIDNLFIEISIFVVGGTILLALTRRFVKKWIKPKNVATNADRVIGMKGFCTEDIKKDMVGEVKVDGKHWSAISDEEIKSGSTVIIKKIDGVKLIVRKENE